MPLWQMNTHFLNLSVSGSSFYAQPLVQSGLPAIEIQPSDMCFFAIACPLKPVSAGRLVNCTIHSFTDRYRNPVSAYSSLPFFVALPQPGTGVSTVTTALDTTRSEIVVTFTPTLAPRGQLQVNSTVCGDSAMVVDVPVMASDIDVKLSSVICFVNDQSSATGQQIALEAGQQMRCRTVLVDRFNNSIQGSGVDINRLGWIEPPELMAPSRLLQDDSWYLLFSISRVGQYNLILTVDKVPIAIPPLGVVINVTAGAADCIASGLDCPFLSSNSSVLVSAGSAVGCFITPLDPFGNAATFPGPQFFHSGQLMYDDPLIPPSNVSFSPPKTRTSDKAVLLVVPYSAGLAYMVVEYLGCSSKKQSPYFTVIAGPLVFATLNASCEPPVVDVGNTTTCSLSGHDAYGNEALTPSMTYISAELNLTCADTCNAFKPCGNFKFPLQYGAQGAINKRLFFEYTFTRPSLGTVTWVTDTAPLSLTGGPTRARTNVTCPLGSELIEDECRCTPGMIFSEAALYIR